MTGCRETSERGKEERFSGTLCVALEIELVELGKRESVDRDRVAYDQMKRNEERKKVD